MPLSNKKTEDPEWLLWACRFEIKHESTIKNFEAKTDSITADTTQLKVDIRDLEVSSTQFQQESNAMKRRIEQLEQDLAEQNRAAAETHAQLRDSIKRHHKQAQEAASLLDEWKKDASVEFKKREREVTALKALLEKLEAAGGQVPTKQIDAKAPSEASTADESMEIDQHVNDKSQNTDNLQQAGVTIMIKLAPQGSVSLEDYLQHGKQAVPEAFKESVKQMEEETVKAFVKNLREKHRQSEVWNKLEAVGWTWQNVLLEMHNMVEDIKRRKRTRGRIKPPSRKT